MSTTIGGVVGGSRFGHNGGTAAAVAKMIRLSVQDTGVPIKRGRGELLDNAHRPTMY